MASAFDACLFIIEGTTFLYCRHIRTAVSPQTATTHEKYSLRHTSLFRVSVRLSKRCGNIYKASDYDSCLSVKQTDAEADIVKFRMVCRIGRKEVAKRLYKPHGTRLLDRQRKFIHDLHASVKTVGIIV